MKGQDATIRFIKTCWLQWYKYTKNIYKPDEVEEVMVFIPLDVSEEKFLIICQLDQKVKVMR